MGLALLGVLILIPILALVTVLYVISINLIWWLKYKVKKIDFIDKVILLFNPEKDGLDHRSKLRHRKRTVPLAFPTRSFFDYFFPQRKRVGKSEIRVRTPRKSDDFKVGCIAASLSVGANGKVGAIAGIQQKENRHRGGERWNNSKCGLD